MPIVSTLRPVSHIAFQVREGIGADRLSRSDQPVEIEEDVRVQHWTEMGDRDSKNACMESTGSGSLSTTREPKATSLTRW
jgi:hypothetical protein